MAIERFLKASRKPVLMEPGDDPLPIASDTFALTQRGGSVTIECWSVARNLLRRVSGVKLERPGRLELEVEHFGGRTGALTLVDLDRTSNRDARRRGARLKYRERFRQSLHRQFPDWRVAELSTEADLHHSLSPSYPRALLRKGTIALAAIGAAEDSLSPDGVLSFGLIWLDYLRRRETRFIVEGLALFLPAGIEHNTCHRVRFLDPQAARFSVFIHDRHGYEERVDPRDYTNLETRLDPYRQPLDGARPKHVGDTEALLESRIRAEIEAIDATLRTTPVYGQVPQFAGGHRSVIDLLAVDGDGRLTVIEIKADQDIHLPLQALDYWMRVKWHLDRGDFTSRGYFPGIPLRSEAPRLLLVAPALEYHPTNEAILKYFSRDITAERLGVGVEWRRDLKVMFRSPREVMALAVLRQIKKALSALNPRELRESADQPVRVGLVGSSPESLGRMETYFAPPHFTPDRRAEATQILVRGGGLGCDVEIYDSSLLRPARAFSFDPDEPEACVRRILRCREELALPLARNLYPFRKPVSHHIIRAVAKENALFCLATALPDVVPSLAMIPWTVGEFTSDTAFLTMNQIRMGFLLAAASDRNIGYREQRSEIGSIIAGAFGWRAIARELVGKVPFGGGLIPKAGIAWAATFAVGLSLERLYRLGYGFTRAERHTAYEEAYENGKQIAGMLLDGFRQRKAV